MLSELEERLLECVSNGDVLNAAQGAIRSHVLRDILLSRSGSGDSITADPRGIRLRNAVVTGHLDLELVTTNVPLELRSCSIERGVSLVDARLPRLVLSGSRIAVGTGPALAADGLTVQGDLILDDGFQAEGADEAGLVRLRGARVQRRLSLCTARLFNRTGPALVADQLAVDGDVLLDRNFTATGSGRLGAVRLAGATIGGLSARSATVTNSAGVAFHGDRLTVSRDIILDEMTLSGDGADGAVRLVAAEVRGQLVLGAGTVHNRSGVCLAGDRLVVQGGLTLRPGLRAVGHGNEGAIRLVGAQVGGQFVISGAALSNASGPALIADRMTVDGSVLMDNGFEGEGGGIDGCVRLVSANIRGQLLVQQATLTNPTGPALSGDALIVEGDCFLRKGLMAAGHGSTGAIRLPGAHLGGQMVIGDAEIRNDQGAALFAEGVRIEGDLLLQSGLRATGYGRLGILRLVGARIGGRLASDGATIENSAGKMLPTITLDEAALGALWVDPAHYLSTGSVLALEGTTYAGVPVYGDVNDWIRLLRYHTPRYSAQPYQHLANAYRAGGREQDARRVLIAQQDDRRDRSLTGSTAWHARLSRVTRRFGLWIQKVTIGYGYRTWPAFTLTVLLAAASAGVGWAAGHTHVDSDRRFALYRPAATSSPAGLPCSSVEQLYFGVRAPFLAYPDRGECKVDTSTRTGQAYAGIFWMLSVLTWASATLAVAGYTGLVRRI